MRTYAPHTRVVSCTLCSMHFRCVKNASFNKDPVSRILRRGTWRVRLVYLRKCEKNWGKFTRELAMIIASREKNAPTSCPHSALFFFYARFIRT